MRTGLVTDSRAEPPPFRFIGGEPALDFANTVDWTRRGLERDRLTSYPRLLQWASRSGIISQQRADALARCASARPRGAYAALASARALRSALHDAFESTAKGGPTQSALDAVGAPLTAALNRLRLVSDRDARVMWGWEGAECRLDSPLWPITWSAARLLTGDERGAIRVCAGLDCGWVYVDRSRNGLRRWCAMASCGTAAKSRRRARRQPR